MSADVRQCAIADALGQIGERWALLVVRELLWGNHRFAGIAAKTGAPRDVLASRLKLLVAEGVVEKRQYSERPPRSEYHLTAKGRALKPVLWALQEWAFAEVPRGEKEPPVVRFPHHDHGLDPRSHFSCGVCGEALS